jgi:hypothetical protein
MTNLNTTQVDSPENHEDSISDRRVEEAVARAHAIFVESHLILSDDRPSEALRFLRILARGGEERLLRLRHLTVGDCRELEALFITAIADL